MVTLYVIGIARMRSAENMGTMQARFKRKHTLRPALLSALVNSRQARPDRYGEYNGEARTTVMRKYQAVMHLRQPRLRHNVTALVSADFVWRRRAFCWETLQRIILFE